IRAALSKQRRRTSGGRWHGANYNCHRRHVRTIKDNGRVRVYIAKERYDRHRVFACSYSTGMRYALGWVSDNPDDPVRMSPVKLRGSIVGYETTVLSHYGGGAYSIRVLDVATGRVLHSVGQGGSG